MKITLGEWKTERGERAIIAAHNPEAQRYCVFVGWVDGEVRTWDEEGGVGDGYRLDNIVSKWADPVPWDWSTTPPWLNYLAVDKSGNWFLYEFRPRKRDDDWIAAGDMMMIPQNYQPKWSSDWKQSLTMRPGYKEAK